MKCQSCSTEGHGILQCPLLHLSIKRSLYLTHSNRQVFQQRIGKEKFPRLVKKFNTLKNIYDTKVKLRKKREFMIAEVLLPNRLPAQIINSRERERSFSLSPTDIHIHIHRFVYIFTYSYIYLFPA